VQGLPDVVRCERPTIECRRRFWYYLISIRRAKRLNALKLIKRFKTQKDAVPEGNLVHNLPGLATK
jgi:hypothetical protein